MLGKLLASPLLTLEPAQLCSFFLPDISTSAPNTAQKVNLSHGVAPRFQINKWRLCSILQPQSVALLETEERKKWETCRQALSGLNFNVEEADVILSKAFGWTHSPYWGEERTKEVPESKSVNETFDYLRSLGLSDDDLFKLLKKFPEVLGCGLHEVKVNVGTLEKQWGIEGKALRNLLLRNPKVLGYNVDCKGDCMAKCTRCWVRF